jgi:hypothetical protein
VDGSGKLVELLLVLALVLGFGLRELWVLRLERRRHQRPEARRKTPP